MPAGTERLPLDFSAAAATAPGNLDSVLRKIGRPHPSVPDAGAVSPASAGWLATIRGFSEKPCALPTATVEIACLKISCS
jgi:hypothetical protein